MTHSRWSTGDFEDEDMREAYREAVKSVGWENRVREEARESFNEEYRHFWPKWIRSLFRK